MKLKDIAHNIGVSPAYLSQVRHGKRPLSEKLRLKLSKLGIKELSKIKHRIDDKYHNNYNFVAEVAQVVEQRTEKLLLGDRYEVSLFHGYSR